VEDLSIRAKSYNIPGVTVDGNDVRAVYDVAADAIARARKGDGPTLVECKTYRWHGHHAGEPKDGLLYRSQKEMDDWREKDPVRRLKELLISEKSITDKDFENMQKELEADLVEAIKFAESSPFPPVLALYDNVYVK
jgi:pyruvate dehydrogenase E1 component alpha subunit